MTEYAELERDRDEWKARALAAERRLAGKTGPLTFEPVRCRSCGRRLYDIVSITCERGRTCCRRHLESAEASAVAAAVRGLQLALDLGADIPDTPAPAGQPGRQRRYRQAQAAERQAVPA